MYMSTFVPSFRLIPETSTLGHDLPWSQGIEDTWALEWRSSEGSRPDAA